MKILVISLLRLGDILLSTSVLRSLKKENPNAEIHILINGQFKSVASLIPNVSKVFTFDRGGLQKIIGTTDRNLMEAYFRVEDLVEELKGEKYGKVINLTHNRLSGWLSALVGANETQGVVFNQSGRFSVGSEWFDYLNDLASPLKENVFHFVDVFHYGVGLQRTDRRIELLESETGRAYADKVFSQFQNKTRILIQPSTSEAKKTFSAFQWKAILSLIAQQGDTEIFVLGAPSEQITVNEICRGQRFIPVICSLEEAYSLMQNAHLLITGDTSIKHLAAATKIKILEVSLGSSEYRKTGAYTQGAVIVQGLAPCAPCSHQGLCSQPTHACAEKISPELISMLALSMIRKDEAALRLLAHEFSDEALVLRTIINDSGDWSAYPLAQKFSQQEIGNWVDRSSHKLFLQKIHQKTIGEYGTEGIFLKQLLQSIFPDQSWREWVTELKGLETDVSWFEARMESFLSRLKNILGSLDNRRELKDFMAELDQFCRDMETSPSFESYSRQLKLALKDLEDQEVPFVIIKKLRERLSTAHQRTKIELKLIRGLQTNFMEIV